MKFLIYREILEKCEALLFVPGKRAYHSRRLFEAAACKTMLVIYCPDEPSKDIYKKHGLTHGFNCIMFDDITKLKNLYILYKNKRKKIVERAYDWVMTIHTFEIRAIELEKVFVKLLENIQKEKDKKIEEIEVVMNK